MLLTDVYLVVPVVYKAVHGGTTMYHLVHYTGTLGTPCDSITLPWPAAAHRVQRGVLLHAVGLRPADQSAVSTAGQLRNEAGQLLQRQLASGQLASCRVATRG